MKTTIKSHIPRQSIPLQVKLFPFLKWMKTVNGQTLLADLIAGLTGAFIVLPQGVSFAIVAGLPAEYGLYTAIIPPIFAALFGSSMHLISGPTTAISIVVFTTLSPLVEPGTADYIRMALTLAFLAGIFQLVLGLARLGTLINFVSHSVIVGFTAGAACLIATGQLKHALGISIPSGSSFLSSWAVIISSTAHINMYESAVAVATIVTGVLFKRYLPRWPGLLFALIVGSLVSFFLDGQDHGVKFLGRLSGRLPPLSSPDFTLDTLRILAPGALAIAMLGLIEALSIARSITVFSRQHINGNQEFIGQGLSNMAGSFFSAYASSGSFTRSSLNYESGAVTPLASIFSALILAVIVMLVAPLTAWLPMAAMGGVILVVAVRLVDVHHIKEILKVSRSDSLVLLATFSGTLFFELEFAIYTGVLLSLATYLTRTSHPSISMMAPDSSDPRRRLVDVSEKDLPQCPQLKILRINGSLFFGAANHVAEVLEDLDEDAPGHVLVIGSGINFIDISGAMMLVQEARRRRKFGKNLFLCRLNADVEHFLCQGGFNQEIGETCIYPTEYEAISNIYHRLAKETCKPCRVRIFTECDSVLPETQT